MLEGIQKYSLTIHFPFLFPPQFFSKSQYPDTIIDGGLSFIMNFCDNDLTLVFWEIFNRRSGLTVAIIGRLQKTFRTLSPSSRITMWISLMLR